MKLFDWFIQTRAGQHLVKETINACIMASKMKPENAGLYELIKIKAQTKVK